MGKDSKKPVIYTIIGIFVVAGILLLGTSCGCDFYASYWSE